MSNVKVDEAGSSVNKYCYKCSKLKPYYELYRYDSLAGCRYEMCKDCVADLARYIKDWLVGNDSVRSW